MTTSSEPSARRRSLISLHLIFVISFALIVTRDALFQIYPCYKPNLCHIEMQSLLFLNQFLGNFKTIYLL